MKQTRLPVRGLHRRIADVQRAKRERTHTAQKHSAPEGGPIRRCHCYGTDYRAGDAKVAGITYRCPYGFFCPFADDDEIAALREGRRPATYPAVPARATRDPGRRFSRG